MAPFRAPLYTAIGPFPRASSPGREFGGGLRRLCFAVRLMSVLVARGYIQGDLGHHPVLIELVRDAIDTFPHKNCSLENDPYRTLCLEFE